MGAEESKATTYFAVYRHGVDEKRRLQIPAKWRGKTPDEELTLVLWDQGREENACLMVFPSRVVWQIIDSLAELPFTDAEVNAIRRTMGEKSDTATVDKGGRICIPDWMAKKAGVDKECVLVGLMDRFQIWNPKKYEESKPANDALAFNGWQKVFNQKRD